MLYWIVGGIAAVVTGLFVNKAMHHSSYKIGDVVKVSVRKIKSVFLQNITERDFQKAEAMGAGTWDFQITDGPNANGEFTGVTRAPTENKDMPAVVLATDILGPSTTPRFFATANAPLAPIGSVGSIVLMAANKLHNKTAGTVAGNTLISRLLTSPQGIRIKITSVGTSTAQGDSLDAVTVAGVSNVPLAPGVIPAPNPTLPAGLHFEFNLSDINPKAQS